MTSVRSSTVLALVGLAISINGCAAANTSSDRCAEAAEYLEACTGEQADHAACTAEAAEEILSKSCDQLAAASSNKADGCPWWLGWAPGCGEGSSDGATGAACETDQEYGGCVHLCKRDGFEPTEERIQACCRTGSCELSSPCQERCITSDCLCYSSCPEGHTVCCDLHGNCQIQR
ncbi:MAG: hypothetical protein JRI23_16470 [Deltaproteobacteria bacterium]|jgi:hypothetical protein|nr:hypothetical protein [Deltaproteobacteria bacterium]MBW2533371.1 hypothetical protein [Deltaproteobacteria bacterium]